MYIRSFVIPNNIIYTYGNNLLIIHFSLNEIAKTKWLKHIIARKGNAEH